MPVLRAQSLTPNWETPPQRIFPELDGISKYQGNSRKSVSGSRTSSMAKDAVLELSMDQEEETNITEDKVVEEVYKLRRGISKAERTVPIGASDKKIDNVMTEEVVEIINQQRKDDQLKPPYKNMSIPEEAWGKPYDLLLKDFISPKLKELKEIFEDAGERMK